MSQPLGGCLWCACTNCHSIPDDVISYIYEHNLYRDLDQTNDDASASKGKEKDPGNVLALPLASGTG